MCVRALYIIIIIIVIVVVVVNVVIGIPFISSSAPDLFSYYISYCFYDKQNQEITDAFFLQFSLDDNDDDDDNDDGDDDDDDDDDEDDGKHFSGVYQFQTIIELYFATLATIVMSRALGGNIRAIAVGWHTLRTG